MARFDVHRNIGPNPLEMVSVATNGFGDLVGTLAPETDRIVRAIDELISVAWG